MAPANGRPVAVFFARVGDPLLFIAPSVIAIVAMHAMGGVELAGVFRHLFLVSLLWLALWCAKSAIRGDKWSSVRTLLAVLQAMVWVGLIALHAGSAIALEAWGQLLTWPIIEVYLKQALETVDVLGLPRWGLVVLVPFAILPVVLASGVFRRGGLHAWSPPGISPRLLGVAFLALAVGAIHQIQTTSVSFESNEREPLGLLLAPDAQLSAFYTWKIPPSPLREAEANAARAAYVPAVPAAERPNVVLIVVDALRNDRIGVAGYPRGITPNIDRFASAEGAWILPAFRSVCAESSCGLLALGRSKYPWEITPSDFSLYEALKANGYRNFFFLSGDHTNFYGLRQTYSPVDLYVDSTEIAGSLLNDDRPLIDAFGSAPDFDGTPTFIQFHLMSTHGLGQRHPEHIRFTPQLSPYLVHFGRRLPVNVDVSKVVNHYDNGVVQLDAEFQRLIDLLDSKGYLSNAWVVLTGDHGELLGESGYVTHARSTEEAVLSPPLILRRFSDTLAPRIAIPSSPLASQVDVAPTLLSLAGLPVPQGWSGVPLSKLPADRTIFFAQGSERGLYALRDGLLHKFTVRGRGDASKLEVFSADGTTKELTVGVDHSLYAQLVRWEVELDDEIGPGWIGEDEVR